jgi:hypothetical protein
MSNQVMPDSDYNVDTIGYGILWQTTKQFHAELLSKSRWLAANDRRNDITAQHVRTALREINQEIHERLTKEENNKRRAWLSLKDFLFAIGSGLIGAFLNELLQIAVKNAQLDSLNAIYWIALVLGIVLYIPFIRSRAD